MTHTSKNTATLVAVSATFLTIAANTHAQAACDASGSLRIKQSNGFVTRCTIQQSGTALAGFCSAGGNSGDIDANRSFLKGNGKFKIVVLWDGGARGSYTAFVEDNGSITDGITRDLSNPSSFATWTSGRQFAC